MEEVLAMVRKKHTIRGYRLITKKYHNRTPDNQDAFDIELLNYWLLVINKLNFKARSFEYLNPSGNDMKHFRLSDIINNHEHYIFGKFKTGTYGTTQEFRNRLTNSPTYQKRENETSGDDVFFYLHKKTGVLLVGADPNYVINSYSLNKYFTYFENLLEPYRKKFNELNKLGKQIYKSQLFSVTSLPPIDFFEELRNMQKIKEASFTIAKEDISESLDVLDALKEIDEHNTFDIEDVEISISLKNKTSRNFVQDFERLFKIMNLSESYDNLKIRGKHNFGDMRTIKNNMPIRTFDCNVDYGTKTYPINEKEVEREFEHIYEREKILANKVQMTKDIERVGDDEKIEGEIIEKAKKFNKKFHLFKIAGGELQYKNSEKDT